MCHSDLRHIWFPPNWLHIPSIPSCLNALIPISRGPQQYLVNTPLLLNITSLPTHYVDMSALCVCSLSLSLSRSLSHIHTHDTHTDTTLSNLTLTCTQSNAHIHIHLLIHLTHPLICEYSHIHTLHSLLLTRPIYHLGPEGICSSLSSSDTS